VMQKKNFVFSPSAGGSLKWAFETTGIEEEVVAYYDNLSFGPIAPPERSLRSDWISKYLLSGGPYWVDCVEEFDDFWRLAAAPDVLPVVWFDRHSASEFSGFLEFVSKMNERDFFVVDVTDASELHGGTCFGSFKPERIIELRLRARATRLTVEERQRYGAVWKQLRDENAPLRTVDSGFRLVSSPLSYFDAAIKRNVHEKWRVSTRVVGETLGAVHFDDRREVSDLLIWARLREMIDAGRVEAEGDTTLMHESRVRLIQSGEIHFE
jgi:hypothetical protein